MAAGAAPMGKEIEIARKAAEVRMRASLLQIAAARAGGGVRPGRREAVRGNVAADGDSFLAPAGGRDVIVLFALAVASGLGRVRAHGELRWAGDLQGGEPYVFRDPRDPGRLVGFEVDLARALAARLGVRERFEQNDWANLVPSLERGDFDIILNGLEDTQALRGRILLSRPYLSFAEQLVVRRGFPLRSLDALRGHRVGTLSASLAQQILRGRPGIELVLYGGQEEPYRDLELGRTDAVLLDSVIAARYGLTKPDLELADADVARGTYVVGLRKQDADLRDAVDGALTALAEA